MMIINQLFNFIAKNPYVVSAIVIFSLITLIYGISNMEDTLDTDTSWTLIFDLMAFFSISGSICVLLILLLSTAAKTFSDKVAIIILICILVIMQVSYWIMLIYNKMSFKYNHHESPLLYRFEEFK